MDIHNILSLDCTVCAVEGTSKKRILEIISQIAAERLEKIDQATILNSLSCRERMGSTGIGNGIALPHGRLANLEKVTAVLITSNPSVAFDAIDNQPVDIFFAILVPEGQTDGHLQTLATIAAKLNDKDIIKAIRGAADDTALYQAIA